MKAKIKSFLGRLGLMTVYIKSKEYFFPNDQIQQEKKIKTARAQFYRSLINKNDLVFDIGANWGNRTEIFLQAGAKVIAIEPLRHCCEYLSYKFKFKPCQIINKGVGSTNRMQALFRPGTSDIIATFSTDFINKTKNRFGERKWDEVSQVEIITIDSLIQKYGIPKFIKIDVEGYELEVLQGLSQKVKMICFEFTYPEFHDQLISCLNLLSNLGNFICNYVIAENTNFAKEHWMTSQELCEEIALFHDRFITWGDIYIKYKNNKEI